MFVANTEGLNRTTEKAVHRLAKTREGRKRCVDQTFFYPSHFLRIHVFTFCRFHPSRPLKLPPPPRRTHFHRFELLTTLTRELGSRAMGEVVEL